MAARDFKITGQFYERAPDFSQTRQTCLVNSHCVLPWTVDGNEVAELYRGYRFYSEIIIEDASAEVHREQKSVPRVCIYKHWKRQIHLPLFHFAEKFKVYLQNRSKFESCFKRGVFSFFLSLFFFKLEQIFSFNFLRAINYAIIAYSITVSKFRMSLLKHSLSHRAQISSYKNTSSSYLAVTFWMIWSSSFNSFQIALFSMLVPPSLGITITWPNRPIEVASYRK